MKPALITVVNPQDNDVISDQLLYYKNIGINDFYIMLHMPDIKLMSMCEFFRDKYKDKNIHLFINSKPEHYHEKDCKVLSDAALEDGCDWIIGSDADELLVLKRHKTIQGFLSGWGMNDYHSLHFQWFEYRPLENLYESALRFMTNRETTPRQQSKSIGKFNKTMAYVPGLHYIENSPQVINIAPDIAFYAHFSDRNKEQYISKMTLQAKNWNQRYGKYTHWAEKLIEDDPEGLEKLWNLMLEQNKNKELVYDPINIWMFSE